MNTKSKKGNSLTESLVTLAILAIAAIYAVIPALFGAGSFGPTRLETIKVNRLYVDGGKESSHYMVGTDKGVFEIDNGWFLGVANADELYSTLEVGKTYQVTTEGNKFVNWLYQEYPYITKVNTIEQN